MAGQNPRVLLGESRDDGPFRLIRGIDHGPSQMDAGQINRNGILMGCQGLKMEVLMGVKKRIHKSGDKTASFTAQVGAESGRYE